MEVDALAGTCGQFGQGSGIRGEGEWGVVVVVHGRGRGPGSGSGHDSLAQSWNKQ